MSVYNTVIWFSVLSAFCAAVLHEEYNSFWNTPLVLKKPSLWSKCALSLFLNKSILLWLNRITLPYVHVTVLCLNALCLLILKKQEISWKSLNYLILRKVFCIYLFICLFVLSVITRKKKKIEVFFHWDFTYHTACDLCIFTKHNNLSIEDLSNISSQIQYCLVQIPHLINIIVYIQKHICVGDVWIFFRCR